MRKITLALIGFFIMAQTVFAEEPNQFKWLEDGDRLRKDCIDSRKTFIIEKNGNIKGYIKRDVINKRRMAVFDRNGNIQGILKKDVLSNDIVYEKLKSSD